MQRSGEEAQRFSTHRVALKGEIAESWLGSHREEGVRGPRGHQTHMELHPVGLQLLSPSSLGKDKALPAGGQWAAELAYLALPPGRALQKGSAKGGLAPWRAAPQLLGRVAHFIGHFGQTLGMGLKIGSFAKWV